jgi:hypothetical protein
MTDATTAAPPAPAVQPTLADELIPKAATAIAGALAVYAFKDQALAPALGSAVLGVLAYGWARLNASKTLPSGIAFAVALLKRPANG